METQKYDSPLWIPRDTAKQIVGKDYKCQQLFHIKPKPTAVNKIIYDTKIGILKCILILRICTKSVI